MKGVMVRWVFVDWSFGLMVVFVFYEWIKKIYLDIRVNIKGTIYVKKDWVKGDF